MKQTIAIYILPNISTSNDNQPTKFGQLTEVFLKNHIQNMAEKLFPDPFLKNQIWEYLWISSLKFFTVCSIVCQVEGYWNVYS